MGITKFAIERNRVTGVLVFLLLVSGLLAYYELPKAQDPGFIVRVAVITTQMPGASPQRMEELVTDKIEKKIQEMPELDYVESESRTGISIVTAAFKETYTDMRPIFDDLRRKVEDAERDLPAGISKPVVNDEFGDVFGSVYALTGDGYDYAELKEYADDFKDTLLRLDNVAKVDIYGAQQEVVYVEYSNSQLTEFGISPQYLSQVLGSVNILNSGGDILSDKERIVLEPTGNFESVDELRRTVLQLPGGQLVYLEDIAKVYRDYLDPPDKLTRANGKPALAMAVSMTEGGDILKLGKELDAMVSDIQASYPWGVEIDKVWFQADLVKQSIDNFMGSLGQSVLIVAIVMILFLGLRTGIVVAALIPSTMVITFFLMQQFDITINQVSLAALIISLGLLVDNAIVVVESVMVKREEGASALDAALAAGSELRAPLLISSLTTAAAFMPIGLAESAVGEYTSDIFSVVTIALLTSWVLSMTFIPMLTMVFLKVKAAEDKEAFTGLMYDCYRAAIRFSLSQRLIIMLLTAGIFYSGIYAFKFVPQVFIAPSEDPVFTGQLELPIGNAVESSQAAVEQLDRFINDTYVNPVDGSQPLLKNWLIYIGEGGPRFTLSLDPPNQNPANSFLIANAYDGKDVDDIMQGIRDYIDDNISDVYHQVSRLENGPSVGFPIQVRLSGEDFEDIYRMAGELTNQLYTYDGVTSVKNTWGMQTKKLVVDVDQARALRAGVTSEDVAYSLDAGLSGIDLTEYREGDELIPVRMRTVVSDRQDLGKLEGMRVYSSSGAEPVPLRQVADVRLVFEPGIIERRDRERTLTIKAQLADGVTAAEVNTAFLPWLEQASQAWTAGTDYEVGGESESSEEANASIAAKMPIAFMCIILLLIWQFNSVRRASIILMTMPLGIIGVAYGLIIAQSSFGFFTILGIISLLGIIINNAIVLIDRIEIEKDEAGRDDYEAIFYACQHRLRPILLTTATTVLGMLPLWWGGSAMFVPMAVAIIFGLLFASVLTLFVVPVLFSLFFRVKAKST